MEVDPNDDIFEEEFTSEDELSSRILYHVNDIKQLLQHGVSKEMARIALPLNMYTEF